MFDLDDGDGGRWPVGDILRARAFLRSPSARNDTWVWSEANLQALSMAIDGEFEAARALALSARQEAARTATGGRVPWVELEGRGNGTLWIQIFAGRTSHGRSVLPVLFKTELESVSTLHRRGEGTLPLLRKAAWWP